MRVNLIHSTLVFREKNIIYMTIRVNLIHSKLVFFLKIQKLNTLNNAIHLHCLRAQCNSLALFTQQCK